MKNIFENKKLWIGIGCGVLVIALIVGIILMAGGNGKENTPTDPTGTTASGDVTNPSDVTDPSDETEPSDVTGPTNGPISDDPGNDEPVVDPDDPSLSDPTEPSTPNGEFPDDIPDPGAGPEEDPEDPTEGNGSAAPSTPAEDDDDPVVEDPKPTERPADTTYDFGGVTPSNVTVADIMSWGSAKYQAWRDIYDPQYLTWDLDTRWRYNCVTSLTDPYYKDGFYCSSEDDYNWISAEYAEPCYYCGKSCCEDTLFRNENGFSEIDPRRCSEYDIKKDPMEYCQECGLKVGYEGCIMFVYDSNCRYCGEWVVAMTCHHCEKYHD